MITLTQAKVARMGIWTSGGIFLTDHPMLHPPSAPEI